MQSREVEEPGPGGLLREEVLSLLGHEVMDESEESVLCDEVMDAFECQCAVQTRLLQQSGGGLNPATPVVTFEFDFQPYVDHVVPRWGSTNVISPRSCSKRGILWTAPILSELSKMGCDAPWIEC